MWNIREFWEIPFFPKCVLLFYMSEKGCKTKSCDESIQDFSGKKKNQCKREENNIQCSI